MGVQAVDGVLDGAGGGVQAGDELVAAEAGQAGLFFAGGLGVAGLPVGVDQDVESLQGRGPNS